MFWLLHQVLLEAAALEARFGKLDKARAVFKFLLRSSYPVSVASKSTNAPSASTATTTTTSTTNSSSSKPLGVKAGPLFCEAAKFEDRLGQESATVKLVQEGIRRSPRYGGLLLVCGCVCVCVCVFVCVCARVALALLPCTVLPFASFGFALLCFGFALLPFASFGFVWLRFAFLWLSLALLCFASLRFDFALPSRCLRCAWFVGVTDDLLRCFVASSFRCRCGGLLVIGSIPANHRR